MDRRFHRVAENLYRSDWGVYYAVCRQAGKRKPVSLDTSNRRTAERKLREHLDKVRATADADCGLVFPTLVEIWRGEYLASMDLKPATRWYYEQNLVCLLRDFPELSRQPVASLTEAHCLAWKVRRIKKASPQRFNNELGILKRICTFAVERSPALLMHSPVTKKISRVRIPAAEINVPTREQFARLTAHLRSRPRTIESAWMVELIAFTATRQNEAASIRWDDLDFDRDEIKVTGGKQGTKNREVRTIPMVPPARTLLLSIPKVSVTVLLAKSCRTAVNNACDFLKMPRFRPHHSLRHYFVMIARDAGIDSKKVAEILGHKSTRLVDEIYNHICSDDMHRAAKKLTAYAFYGDKMRGQRPPSPISQDVVVQFPGL